MGLDVWGPGKPRKRTSPSTWANVKRWDARARKEGVSDLVFCASLADVFEEGTWKFDLEDEAEKPKDLDLVRANLWDLIEETTNLTFQLLTKRPENVLRMLPAELARSGKVWVGASMENQAWADRRMPAMAALRMTYPDLVLFASYEPALGPVDFRLGLGTPIPTAMNPNVSLGVKPRILDWLIVGGESGPGARPFDPEWARRVLRDAEGTGAAVFVKQFGSVWAAENGARHTKGGLMDEWPSDLRVREFPKNGAQSSASTMKSQASGA